MKLSTVLLFLSMALFTNSDVLSQTFEVYVCDAEDFSNPPWKILKYDENGENPEVFINENLAWPQDILFLEDQGIVLISNLNSGRITKYDSELGTYIGNFATGIGGPTRMKIGTDNLLYVIQWQGNGSVRRYQLDGTYVDEFTSLGVTQSIGLDWDSDGNLYVSSWSGNSVRKFDSDGNDLGLFINSSLQGPTNIWFNESGELLVANWNGTTVKKFDAQGNLLGDFITGLSNPEGVAIYPNGNILIGNGGTGAVKLFDSEGTFIEDFISSGAGGLQTPNAVVLREITQVSVEQVDIESVKDFVHPSIGHLFTLNPLFKLDIQSIEVYDLSGVLVEKKDLIDEQIWNANAFPEGAYIITAKSAERIIATQKVIVKK